jgi:hypothetical protein
VEEERQPRVPGIPEAVVDRDEGERHRPPCVVEQAHALRDVARAHRPRELHVRAERVLRQHRRRREDGDDARRIPRRQRLGREGPLDHGAVHGRARDVRHVGGEAEQRAEVQPLGVERVGAGDRGRARPDGNGEDRERRLPGRRVGQQDARRVAERCDADAVRALRGRFDPQRRRGRGGRDGREEARGRPARAQRQKRRTGSGVKSSWPPASRRSTTTWLSPRLSICWMPVPERDSNATPLV